MTYRIQVAQEDRSLVGGYAPEGGRFLTSTALTPTRLGGEVEVLRRAVTPPILQDDLGRLMVRALRAPSSLWPVRTGRSKRGFSYQTGGRAGVVLLTNREDYAVYVEGHTGAARRTLANARNMIIAGLERALERRLREVRPQFGQGLGRGFGRGPTRRAS